MADIFVKQRGGTRGGLEQFKWDDIKEQKYGDRECYLGGSTMIGTQRRGYFDKNDWWTKEREKLKDLEDEKAAVQKYEEEMMQEALGLRPKKHLLRKSELTADQIKALFEKEQQEEEEKEEKTGIGFGAYGSADTGSSTDKLAGSSADVLKDFDIEKGEQEEERQAAGSKDGAPRARSGSPEKGMKRSREEEEQMDPKALKKLKKQEKKEAKKEKKRAKKEKKKEKKKAKKEKKRAKKEAKKDWRDDDSSSSSSS